MVLCQVLMQNLELYQVVGRKNSFNRYESCIVAFVLEIGFRIFMRGLRFFFFFCVGYINIMLPKSELR